MICEFIERFEINCFKISELNNYIFMLRIVKISKEIIPNYFILRENNKNNLIYLIFVLCNIKLFLVNPELIINFPYSYSICKLNKGKKNII